jgi:hypothetical protein
VRLSKRALNRTLLERQHLLRRTNLAVPAMVKHLVGLQAQAPMPPYLSLAARLESFDPLDVTRGLEERTLVRYLSMRSTVHLLVADDALSMRSFTAPVHAKERKISQNTAPALHLDPAEVEAAVREVLAGGSLPLARLGDRLTERWPELPPNALNALARLDAPVVQVPPRGAWKQSGGVAYACVDDWLGRPQTAMDVEDLARRYLCAYGPASAADMVAWSSITGLAPVLKAMPDLEVVEDEDGKKLYDVPDAPYADEDAPAPVRLLGLYDNVWLSHAGRDRVTAPDKRKLWMGANGGNDATIFVDGMMEGLWRVVEGRPQVVTTFRTLTKAEQSDLDDELDRVAALLAVT